MQSGTKRNLLLSVFAGFALDRVLKRQTDIEIARMMYNTYVQKTTFFEQPIKSETADKQIVGAPNGSAQDPKDS